MASAHLCSGTAAAPTAPAHTDRRPTTEQILAAVERRPVSVVVLLLALQTALLAWSAYCHCPTVDEVAHLPAGLNIWLNGRFDLYHVNPPLVKALAAAPVVLAQPKTNWKNWNQRPGGRSEWIVGRDFFLANKQRTFWLFALARWACIPLAWLGGWVCFAWAREWYGPLAGVLACALWCFCPTVLGHAAMITPDAGAAATGALAGYAFWRWIARPSWSAASWSGLALGLALLTKTTWILLFGLWPLLWLGTRSLSPSGDRSLRAIARQLGQLLTMLIIGVYVLNLGYGYDRTGQALGDYQFVSRSLAGPDHFDPDRRKHGNRFRDGWLGACPVPLPAAFLLGIDLQKHDFEVGKLCYLRGELRQGGWWYFYLYAALVKTPLGVLLLAGMVLGKNLARGSLHRWRRDLLLLAPAALLFVVVSAETGFTIFLRYVLPAFPFLLIWISQVAEWARSGSRCVRAAVTACIVWALNSSGFYHPHSLAYFNELAGGPRGGAAHLLDGNLDWGQDLLLLKEWLRKHPEAKPLQLAYYGQVNPRHAAIDFVNPATAPAAEGLAEWGVRHQQWEAERAAVMERIDALERETGWSPPTPQWRPAEVLRAESENGARFSISPDGAVALSEAAPERDVYRLTLAADVERVAAFRLEVEPDPELRLRAVGRAENGNFVLNDFAVEFLDGSDTNQPAAWRRAVADWSQPRFPASAAIDDDPRSGWAMLPLVQQRHFAVFELAEPRELKAGDRILVRLSQNWGKRHVISRLKVSLSDCSPTEPWRSFLQRPLAELEPAELRAREEILAQAPPLLQPWYRALTEVGGRRPEPPPDLSPSWLTPGWYAVSVNFVKGYPGKGWAGDGKLLTFERSAFEYFGEFTPVATAGYSIYVYHITYEEANRARRRYGLPELAPAAELE